MTTALEATATFPRGPGRSWFADGEVGEELLEVEGLQGGGADGCAAVRSDHLLGRVAAGLGVAGELDVLPADEVLVAAVLGGAVHALGRVLEDEAREADGDVGAGDEDVLLWPAQGDEVLRRREHLRRGVVEVLHALHVLVLQADVVATGGDVGPLAFGEALRALEQRAPAQLVGRRERRRAGKVVGVGRRRRASEGPRRRPGAAAEGALAPDAVARVEGAEEEVDVGGDVGLSRPGVLFRRVVLG